jgi:pyruvate,orthophosphate dikinase
MSSLAPIDAVAEPPDEGGLAGALGQKGALLRRAVTLGCPVPPGFHVPAGWCGAGGALPDDRLRQLDQALDALAARTGLALDGERPLCVAVRASSVAPQPGERPTVLDAGASHAALRGLADRLGSRLAALDCRVRFLRGLARSRGAATAANVRGVRPSAQAPTESQLEAEIAELEARLFAGGPSSARDEILAALLAVGASGAPVVVQAMAYGNSVRGPSGAGTASSRHPIQGEAVVFGEVAWGRQGEDVSLGRGAGVSIRAAAAGRRAEESLERRAPEAFAELSALLELLERDLDAVVDAEIVLEAGQLSLVQVRPTALTPRAEIRVAVDLVREGRMTREQALGRVRVTSLAKVGRLELLDEEALRASGAEVLGRGLGASPGAATGVVAIEVDDALARAAAGQKVVLVRSDASPEDAPAVRAAVGVATASGGLTSHAAVMSRALGRPCAVSVSNLRVRGDHVMAELPGGRTVRLAAGDVVSVDGGRGLLVSGAAPTRWVGEDDAPRELAGWARTLHPRMVVVDHVEGADPVARAASLEADGVWNGHTVTDSSGVPRPELGPPASWSDPDAPWPDAASVLVPAALVAAARLAGARSVGVR